MFWYLTITRMNYIILLSKQCIYPTARPDICNSVKFNLYVSHLNIQETRLLVKRVNMYSAIGTVQYGPM